MRELSERYYAAGWYMGLATSLWEALVGVETNREFREGETMQLALYLQRARCWFRWDDKAMAVVRVPIKDWMRTYARERL